VNVVYAADERGFLSVEPYAHWPTLRPFPWVGRDAAASRERYPTAIAFMKALTEWLGGWSNISERSQRSLARVGETLCGYPPARERKPATRLGRSATSLDDCYSASGSIPFVGKPGSGEVPARRGRRLSTAGRPPATRKEPVSGVNGGAQEIHSSPSLSRRTRHQTSLKHNGQRWRALAVQITNRELYH